MKGICRNPGALLVILAQFTTQDFWYLIEVGGVGGGFQGLPERILPNSLFKILPSEMNTIVKSTAYNGVERLKSQVSFSCGKECAR